MEGLAVGRAKHDWFPRDVTPWASSVLTVEWSGRRNLVAAKHKAVCASWLSHPQTAMSR